MKAAVSRALLMGLAGAALCAGLPAHASGVALAYAPPNPVPNAVSPLGDAVPNGEDAVVHRASVKRLIFAFRGQVLGALAVTVLSDRTLEIPLTDLLRLLRPVVGAKTLAALSARAAKLERTTVTPDDIRAAAIDVDVDLGRPERKPKPVRLASNSTIVPLPPSPPRVDTAPPVVPTVPVVPHPPNKKIDLIVPLKERNFYIGDITIGIAPDGSVDLPLDRLLELLKPIASQGLLDAIKKQAAGRARIGFSDLNVLKLTASYDPSTLEVSIVLPLGDRQRRNIELFSQGGRALGQFSTPASPSAWLTWRTSFDYVSTGAGHDDGFVPPVVDLTGAFRAFGAVLSAGGSVDTNQTDRHQFRRDFTRLTYDDPQHAQRWQLGDLDPAVVGFQSSPDMAGISILKSYSALQPSRNIRPRGLATFSLRDPSKVDVLINGQFVRRLTLDEGTYDLHNFPFTAGQNNVQLVVQDPTGRRELYSYQQFYDLDLLEPGLTEYQLAAGVAAPFQSGQPHYDTSDLVATGFLRRGMSDDLTLGANGQADRHSAMLGLESVWASPVGIVSTQFAGSRNSGRLGWAAMLNFQHQNNPDPGGHRWSFGLDMTATSPWFSAIGNMPSRNDTALEGSAFLSRELSPETTLNLDAGYLWKRHGEDNVGRARAAIYQRIGSATSIGAELRWDQSLGGHRDVSVYITISTRFGSDEYASASYDGSNDRTRLSWQKTPTSIYDDWSFTADAERVPGSTAINATAYRQWNRLETSLSSSATVDEDGQKVSDERTSLRAAGSIAFAGGAVAIGRPINDSFAIVEAHSTLDGSTVRVDPRGGGEDASTDGLGPALVPDLAGYSRRTLTVAVDKLPTGYNLGTGSFDLLPPYMGGYKLTVGSDYSISVIGVLDDRDGKPVTLVAGKAYLVAAPADHPVDLFTDRIGRFAAVGLKPGLWRIELGPFKYDLPVGKEGQTLRRLAAPLTPAEDKP